MPKNPATQGHHTHSHFTPTHVTLHSHSDTLALSQTHVHSFIHINSSSHCTHSHLLSHPLTSHIHSFTVTRHTHCHSCTQTFPVTDILALARALTLLCSTHSRTRRDEGGGRGHLWVPASRTLLGQEGWVPRQRPGRESRQPRPHPAQGGVGRGATGRGAAGCGGVGSRTPAALAPASRPRHPVPRDRVAVGAARAEAPGPAGP